jgi:hypothetical protein
MVAAGSYLTLFSILLWQALRGQSLLAPDGATIAVAGAWLLITAAAAAISVARLPILRRPAVV